MKPRLVALLLLGLSALMLLGTTPASAAGEVRPPSVQVVKVKGLIDPPLADSVRGAVEAAASKGAMVVLQIDSLGSYGDEAQQLASYLRTLTIPVVGWVGPAGARAEGGALYLVYGSGLAVMAAGAGIGPGLPSDLGTTAGSEPEAQVAAFRAELQGLAADAGATAAGVDQVVSGPALAAGPAEDAGAVALAAPRPPDDPGIVGLLRAIDGREVSTAAGPVTVDTVDDEGVPPPIGFHDIGPLKRVLHAVTTPTACYVLLILAMWGIAFELTQPGFGLAGIAGVLALALAVYALTVIPVNWLGLILLVAGTGAMALDVVVRRFGPLTFGGTAAFLGGSILTWWGVAPAIDLAWWLVALATVGGFLFFGFGMTVAVKARERIRTSQIGLVGLVGEARSDLNPEGGVYVKGTLWRARASEGHVASGTRVRVSGIDGLVLRVRAEPEPGGGAGGEAG